MNSPLILDRPIYFGHCFRQLGKKNANSQKNRSVVKVKKPLSTIQRMNAGKKPANGNPSGKTASEEVTDMIFLNKWSSQTLCAGAELGVFDFLNQDSARSAIEVATDMNLDPALLYRLLRALASLGLLNETTTGHFTLTEGGTLIRSDAPGSLRYMAMLEGGEEHWAIWKYVPAMIRDGRQNAFLREYGETAFDHARANPGGYGAIFGKAMSAFSAIQSGWALEALHYYDFSPVATWCDVGGGHGHMMCSFLAAYPHLSGTVLDLPEVVEQKEQLWTARFGVEKRCRYVAADMFKEVSTEADVYSLKMILHDWNDSECIQILQNIRRQAKPGKRIFIIEHIVRGPSESHIAKLFDIHMMCWGSGRERTEEEYASLLVSSGWRYAACYYPSHASMGVVEGVAV